MTIYTVSVVVVWQRHVRRDQDNIRGKATWPVMSLDGAIGVLLYGILVVRVVGPGCAMCDSGGWWAAYVRLASERQEKGVLSSRYQWCTNRK